MDGGEGVALPGAEPERDLMKTGRWKKAFDLFQTAVERAPEERAAFLDESCHGDEEMRREVESLLISHQRAENFIEVPAFEAAPEFVPTDSADALVGSLIGHYRIESLIGVGNCRASSLSTGCRARCRRRAPRHQTREHHAATGR